MISFTNDLTFPNYGNGDLLYKKDQYGLAIGASINTALKTIGLMVHVTNKDGQIINQLPVREFLIREDGIQMNDQFTKLDGAYSTWAPKLLKNAESPEFLALIGDVVVGYNEESKPLKNFIAIPA